MRAAGAMLASVCNAAPRALRADVAVIGGGTGGCAAALAALRNGMRVIMTEETDWIGGQLTSQAVPPDEHQWIESFGSTRTYREYRAAVREYYRRNYPLTQEARARWNLNPGDGSVSRLTHEPRVSLAVLEEMLAPHASGGRLSVLLRHVPVSADTAGDSVRSVQVRDLETGRTRTIAAPYFIDATEQGDLLPLTRTEYVTGFESRKQTGEPHAPDEAQPANIQAFTFCFAIDYLAGQDHTIEKPEEYDFWRSYVPELKPPWPGKLLSWSMSNPITLKPRAVIFDPGGATKDGKSSMSIQAMLSALASDNGVLAFSHEMTRLTVAYRMLAMTSEISHSHFRDSREMQMFEWPHVEESAQVLSQKNLWIYDAGTVDINTLRALTRFHVRQHKIKLVIVDFIQKIRAKGDRKHEIVSNVSEGLRELAKSENIAVLALSQMSNPEEKKKRRPRIFDIKESGDVPADAHGVYAVYRPLDDRGRYDGNDEFGILAQRSGPGGAWVAVKFNESTLKFESRWT